jgi:HK97 family phage major capsid protein
MSAELQKSVETLTTEISGLNTLFAKAKEEQETKWAEMKGQLDGKVAGEALEKQAKELSAEYAKVSQQVQTIGETLADLQKQIDNPLFSSNGSERAEAERDHAVELQKRAFIAKGGMEDDFNADLEQLVNPEHYRKAVKKLMAAGLKSRAEIIRSFTADEQKAFDMASLDIAFFSPEMLGLTIDCNIECWSLVDLYGQESVSRSTFMYPKIESYGQLGAYDCDAKCDAELGEPGNLRYLNGKTYDFRGVFCFQRKVLQEANYDLLGFMMRAAQRSYRINRNRVLMVGDGVNEPLGWMTADCFTKLATPTVTNEDGSTTPNFNHVDFRRFLSSAPVEYGEVVAVMHQNIFGYLASAVDNNGRFIFGDGDMTFSPDRVRERIRISNCLPDATANNTKGDRANPFTPGDFLVAAGNWNMAYKAVSKRPLWMQQYEGGSTAWCVKYVFGAEDGGFVGCCPAARILQVG